MTRCCAGESATTDPPPSSDRVWVTVDRVRQPRAEWTYTLSDFEPGTPPYCTIQGHQTPLKQICHSYTELCAWLQTYGYTAPPPEYFAPTPEELAEGAESIIRPVTRPGTVGNHG